MHKAYKLRHLVALISVSSLVGAARADVLDITARTAARVARFTTSQPAHVSEEMQVYPGASLPVTSTARVDRTDNFGNILASAQCTSVFNDQRVTHAFPPTDFGVDIGAFSSDDQTYYEIDGSTQQTRRIRITQAETQMIDGTAIRARSIFGIAGAFIVVGTGDVSDLSGLKVEMLFSVTQYRSSQGDLTRLAGRATLLGGPNRALTLEGAGAINASQFEVIDLLPLVPDLAEQGVGFARAVVFSAVTFQYEYDANVGEEFDLTAVFGARVNTIAADVGAAAIFGLPQVALPETTARTRHDDMGDKLRLAVESLVDTTGQDLPGGGTTLTPRPTMCGIFGLEFPLFAMAGAAVFACRCAKWRRFD